MESQRPRASARYVGLRCSESERVKAETHADWSYCESKAGYLAKELSLTICLRGHFLNFHDLSYTLDTTSHNQLKTTTEEGRDATCPITAEAPHRRGKEAI